MNADHALPQWNGPRALRVLASAWARLSGRPALAASASADATPSQQTRAAAVPARRRTDIVHLGAARPTIPAALLSSQPAPLGDEPLLKSHRDTLTGLMTLDHLADTGAQWSSELAEKRLSACVLRVGLEGFDEVVDRYGRHAGDQALVQIAKRLRQLSRTEDRVIRCGATEFLLLLSCPETEAAAFARSIAGRVVADLQRPLSYRTVSHLPVGCCIGSALWPDQGATLDQVRGHAEEALAWARLSGRGQMRQYVYVDQSVAA